MSKGQRLALVFFIWESLHFFLSLHVQDEWRWGTLVLMLLCALVFVYGDEK